MEIHRETIDQGTIIHLQGRFDTMAAVEFEKEIMSIIEDGAKLLIIDCKEMNYMSSSILRVFLLGLKTIRRNNGKIYLADLQTHIKEVFDISGFLDLFEIFSTRDEALAAI
jgi:anti-anti-sigma factor